MKSIAWIVYQVVVVFTLSLFVSSCSRSDTDNQFISDEAYRLMIEYRDDLSSRKDVDRLIEQAIKVIDSRDAAELGYILEIFEMFDDARIWYRKFHKNNAWAKYSYAQLLFTGEGGGRDIGGAIDLYLEMSESGSEFLSDRYVRFLYDLDFNYEFSTYATRIRWFEIFSDQGATISLAPGDGTEDLYDHIAKQYWRSVESHIGYDSMELNENTHQKVEAAMVYFELAKNQEGVDAVRNIMAKKHKQDSSIGSPDNNYIMKVCEDVFANRYRENMYRARKQKEIFLDPERSKDISEKYREYIFSRYDNHYGKKFSLEFSGIEIGTFIRLYFDFVFDIRDTGRRVTIVIDDSLAGIPVATREKIIPSSVLINHLLYEFDIDVSCDNDKIRFSRKEGGGKDGKRITLDLIDDWSGDFEITESGISGSGRIHYGDRFYFSGNVVNSVPNGEGGYYYGEDGVFYMSSSVVNGMLQGEGEVYYGGRLVYAGGFSDGLYSGVGRFIEALGQFRRFYYEGQLEEGRPQGEGYIAYLRGDYPTYGRYIPLDEPLDVVSTFSGNFNKGLPHGAGVCGLRRGEDFDYVPCEFFKGDLISLAGRSLLPAQEGRFDHLDLLL